MCAAMLRAVHAVCRERAQKRLEHAKDTERGVAWRRRSDEFEVLHRHNTLARVKTPKRP